MINLNRQLITKQDVLNETTDVDIYRFYVGGNINFSQKIISPLRKDDIRPSLGFFKGDNGEICFNDFVLGGGDCIKFVQLLKGLDFFEALSLIAIDFGFADKYIVKKIKGSETVYDSSKYESRDKIISKIVAFNLGIKRRAWTAYDYAYWLQFGIDSQTLDKYNVVPVSYIFMNGLPILAEKYAYAFIEFKGGVETYKIYQPFSKSYKWLSNHNGSVWQGWSQLPEKGKRLIITKSLKDVMAIDCITGVPVVSLQSESVMPKASIIQELRNRFEQIWILYDNDFDKEVNWGHKFGAEIAEENFIPQIEIDSIYRSKDFSDLVKNKSAATASEVLRQLITDYETAPF